MDACLLQTAFSEGAHSPDSARTSNRQRTRQPTKSKQRVRSTWPDPVRGALPPSPFTLTQPHEAGITVKPVLKRKKHAEKGTLHCQSSVHFTRHRLRLRTDHTLAASDLHRKPQSPAPPDHESNGHRSAVTWNWTPAPPALPARHDDDSALRQGCGMCPESLLFLVADLQLSTRFTLPKLLAHSHFIHPEPCTEAGSQGCHLQVPNNSTAGTQTTGHSRTAGSARPPPAPAGPPRGGHRLASLSLPREMRLPDHLPPTASSRGSGAASHLRRRPPDKRRPQVPPTARPAARTRTD